MPNKFEKISIIIPVYNEERTISMLLKGVLSAELPAGMTREVVIVDDGSTDKTPRLLAQLNTVPEVRVFRLAKNQGKTAAVMEGIRRCSGDCVLIQDADLEYDPKHYAALLAPLTKGEAQVVYGSRFSGDISGMTFINRLANEISTRTFNVLFRQRLTDLHTGYKAFDREVLQQVRLDTYGFVFDTEISVKLADQGINIIEVPIVYSARTREEGKKITWRKASVSYFWMLGYWWGLLWKSRGGI